ncbi:hypothetical protein [Microbacterium sp. SA39]|uniref:hypothetical protein n=1 Tax=Microbacterium sp. SA39 TaxID=1263625 RepID=UPI0006200A3B|nr:hypothetical protein [Microbacterium sp. SA39]KJQ54158.1 hypothetical protein RS85_02229 [Microbacterium sp. SA39]
MEWRWQGINLTGKRVATAPDFTIYDRIEVTGFDDRENEFTLRLSYRESEARYVVQGIQIDVADAEEEITGAWLRDLPVLALSRAALREGGVVEFQAGGVFMPDVVEAAAQEIRSGGPSSEEAMLATARVYRYAQIMQQSPAKAVQRTLGLTAPTATLWIRRARSLGLLGESVESDG